MGIRGGKLLSILDVSVLKVSSTPPPEVAGNLTYSSNWLS